MKCLLLVVTGDIKELTNISYLNLTHYYIFAWYCNCHHNSNTMLQYTCDHKEIKEVNLTSTYVRYKQ